MKKLFAAMLAAAVLITPMGVCAAPGASPTPAYEWAAVADDDGLTDDLRYTFPAGDVVLSPPFECLLMVDGDFIPARAYNDRAAITHVLLDAWVPLRAVMEHMGAAVRWDDKTRTAAATLLNDVFAVTIDGEAAILIDNRAYVHASALAGAFGLMNGWLAAGQIAENPVVALSAYEADWEPNLKPLQADCRKALALMKADRGDAVYQYIKDWDPLQVADTFALIEERIENMAVAGHIGPYAIVQGPYTMLVSQSGQAWFYRPVNTSGYMLKPDFTNPQTFFGGYFAG